MISQFPIISCLHPEEMCRLKQIERDIYGAFWAVAGANHCSIRRST